MWVCSYKYSLLCNRFGNGCNVGDSVVVWLETFDVYQKTRTESFSAE